MREPVAGEKLRRGLDRRPKAGNIENDGRRAIGADAARQRMMQVTGVEGRVAHAQPRFAAGVLVERGHHHHDVGGHLLDQTLDGREVERSSARTFAPVCSSSHGSWP